MNRGVITMLVVAAILVVLYYALQPPQPPPQSATATAPRATTLSTTPSTATLPPTTTPTRTTPTATPQTPTKPTGETPRATATTTTPQHAPRYVPKVEVEVLAPTAVNATKLPIAVNYTVVLRNVGNATAVVNVSGALVRVGPGEEVRLNYTAVANAAGRLKLAVEVNGTEYARETFVYYYTAALEAEPVVINVTRLPAEVRVRARVINRGNYTGYVNGVEIPPGRAAEVYINATLEAAGTYALRVDGVEVPLVVYYYAPTLAWKVGGPREVEAVPGEKVAAWLWAKNTGNATAAVEIDGRVVTLAPGQEINVTKAAEARPGEMEIAFTVNGTRAVHTVRVALVVPQVRFIIKKPQEAVVWADPGDVEYTTVYADDKKAALEWSLKISTNATKRTVTLAVSYPGGYKTYTLKPGDVVEESFTQEVQAPGTVTLEVGVNGTKYALQIRLKLRPPTINFDFNTVTFTDKRSVKAEVRCKIYGFPIPEIIEVLEVSGTLRYTEAGREIDGIVRARRQIGGGYEEYTGIYIGYVTGGRGNVTIKAPKYTVYIEFDISPLVITKVVINDQPWDCSVDTSLIPPILYKEKPVARGEPADQYAARIVAVFAKGDSDMPYSYEWMGDYALVVDRRGNEIKVYFREGRIVAEGALSATLE